MQHKIKLFHYLLLILFWCIAGNHALASEHKIRVVVNGSAITDLDWHRRATLLAILQGGAKGGKNASLNEQALQILIDEKLLEQDARKRKIEIEDEDLAQAWGSIAERNQLSAAELKQQMVASGIDVKEFENQIRHQILQAKILRLVIEPQVTVSEIEIQEWLQAENKGSKVRGAEEISVKQTALQQKMLLQLRTYMQGLRRDAYIERKKG